MNIEKLGKILQEQSQPKFRLEQIRKAVYQDGVSDFSEISNLPKDLRELLDKKVNILSFTGEDVLVSRDKKSAKALLKFPDGHRIETVLMSPRPGFWSACVSSQIGCGMSCVFCATGQSGFQRNLTAEEISDQVLFWKQWLRNPSPALPLERGGGKLSSQNLPLERGGGKLSSQNLPLERGGGKPSSQNLPLEIRGDISNIVYMGMGEPFLNWEEVSQSLKILLDKEYFNFGARSISISTVGVPRGIEKLMRDFPQINLAVSLHFVDNEQRGKFMPANQSFNLNDLKKDLEEYFTKCKRKVFLEYILFSGLNDGEKSAQKLTAYIKSLKNNYLLHVNLIRYNATKKGQFEPSNEKKVLNFRNYLLEKNINCTVRKSLGDDIGGACGQLTTKKYEKK